MCGICGFYGFEDKDLIKSMTKIIAHRGPDDHGVFIEKNISLGHRRLSIIDLSKAGHQPMANQEQNLHISYNGEIYNFQELRDELKTKGYKFSSNTDTEVVLLSYQEYGEKCVEKFNGMFAFAIWNSKNKSIFLARDRLGIKPLYYHYDKNKNHFTFGSEIKSILLHPNVKRVINQDSLNHYLNLRYIPGEDTLFEEIKKLLPGHTLTFNPIRGIKLSKFWDIPHPKSNADPSEFRDRLEKSIQLRLIADVPLGVYLSGGIDSASIVALTSKLKTQSNQPLMTFSVGFNSEYDELSKAKIIADHFSTDHKEIIVNEPITKLLPKIIWHLDQPHGDPVVIPMIKLSEAASNEVKVVLSGEGADETLGGYAHYKTMLKAQKLRCLPQLITKTASKLVPISILDKLNDYPHSIGQKGKEKLLDFFSHLNSEHIAYNDLITILSDNDRFELELPELLPPQFTSKSTLLNKILNFDTNSWLPNYPLYINDRMTMANSIEGRVPFLDHTFVEYCTHLPSKFKLNKTDKAILRTSMKNTLPKSKKHAFLMPLDNWIKDLSSLSDELFQNTIYQGYLTKIINNYNNSKLIYGKQLFTFSMFGVWKELFIDSEKWKKPI